MKTRNATKIRNASRLKSGNTKRRCRSTFGRRTIVAASLLCTAGSAFAIATALVIPVPAPLDIGNYISNQFAAEQLGKALFWDMQVGSDGVQACATCHFHSGVDARTRNQLNPKDGLFGNNNLALPEPAPGSMAVDQEITAVHFPLHRLTDQHLIGEPLANPENVVRDTNDVMGSMGLKRTQFNDIVINSAVDDGTEIPDPIFNVNGANVRQVTGRNTPSAINAVFNFENFHDGRANNIFNGANPFGPADPRPHLITNTTGSLATEELRIRQSSLASQSVGPPLDTTEMSFIGRTFPKLGKKMLSLKPLAQQQVSTTDSRLGFLSDTVAGTGLTRTYKAMIEAAFAPRYWNNTTEKVTFDANGIPSFSAGPADPLNTNEFTQMEANFATFWGLAIQAYESTLVANESKFDQFILNGAGLNNEELLGMAIYNGVGGCTLCHDGATLMDNDHAFIQGIDPLTDVPIPFNQDPLAANEIMQIATGIGLYDNGFHNTGVRPQGNPDPSAIDFLPTNEDVGRGGTTGLGGGMTEISLSKGILGLQKQFPGTVLQQVPGLDPLPAHVADWVPPLPLGFQPFHTTPHAGRVTNFGAFRTPSIRNLTLTGPYMHNGGLSTIRQIVDFYVRGGDFPRTNDQNFDSEGMSVLPLLTDAGAIPNDFTPEEKRDALVQFLMALTDDRVANEEAPFDHPELFVPITGSAPMSTGRAGFVSNPTDFQRIAAVGSFGRSFVGMPPLDSFLGLDQRSVGLVADADLDLIEDSADNCPVHANPLQEDDGDSDGVGDACDNCTQVANADQRDTDADGYGNRCDADLNNDPAALVNVFDLGQFRSVFGSAAPGIEPYELADHADFNGDGNVNVFDLGILRSLFGGTAGPSALNP